jgi:hypothetical protein
MNTRNDEESRLACFVKRHYNDAFRNILVISDLRLDFVRPLLVPSLRRCKSPKDLNMHNPELRYACSGLCISFVYSLIGYVKLKFDCV